MAMSSTPFEESESKEKIKTTSWSSDLSRIVLSYLSNDTDKSAVKLPSAFHLSGLYFFGDENLALAHTLSYYVLWGNPDKQFEEIITQNKRILLQEVERIDLQGIPRRGTLYQLLLQVDDNYIRNAKGETFLEMVRRVLISLPNGEIEEAKQKEKWFRDWDEASHIRELKLEFKKVADAFDQSPAITEDAFFENTFLQATIQTFNKYLSNIRVPKNCIRELWDHANDFFNYLKYETYGAYKSNYFCCKILGLIEWHLPAWGMQALDSGLFFIANHNKEVPRIDISHYYKTAASSIDVSSSSSSSSSAPGFFLGDNVFIDSFGLMQSLAKEQMRPVSRDSLSPRFSILCQRAKISQSLKTNNTTPAMCTHTTASKTT